MMQGPRQSEPSASHKDGEALLDTANSASQHVAVLHVAFMALCAYVLVIVFGTTDMDLLIGKGVKLPVVDVTVPIVGFYAFAPYLVVLVHFNLLLQLQLLSRKLYAFAAAAKKEGLGSLRDRLHIFPFTYYLVGKPGRVVRRLLPIVVRITLLVLPLATLLVLQLRFLAYQHQAVTWAQRAAVWFDVALVIALWPVIMDRRDSWRAYLRRVRSCLRWRWRMGLAWAAVWVGVVASGFATTREGYFVALAAIPGLLILLGIATAVARLRRWWRGQRREPEDAIPAASPMVRGMPGFLMVVTLGVPLPLGLLADGEWWEEKLLGGKVVASEVVYGRYRFLDLSEQVLLAKPAKPELVAQFREGDPEKVKEALKQIERVKLSGRSLRGASLSGALLPGADLREAQLQGANLEGAHLQDADLREAWLEGADFRFAGLYSENVEESGTALMELEGASWTPLNEERLAEIRELLHKTIIDTYVRKGALERIERAGLDPPILESCLIDPEAPGLKCQRQWLPAEVEAFQRELFPVLEGLACQSSAIARGLIRRVDTWETTGARSGLAGRSVALLDKQECKGLSSLPQAEKNRIRDLAKREDEERRGQSEARKSAEEVPVSPTLPPAIAPATP